MHDVRVHTNGMLITVHTYSHYTQLYSCTMVECIPTVHLLYALPNFMLCGTIKLRLFVIVQCAHARTRYEYRSVYCYNATCMALLIFLVSLCYQATHASTKTRFAALELYGTRAENICLGVPLAGGLVFSLDVLKNSSNVARPFR